MLKSMRKHAKYFYFLFFLIILTFVFWGVGVNDQSQSQPLAVIGDQHISTLEYWRAVDRMDDVYRNAYGKDYTEEMRTDVREQVLSSLIEESVLAQAAMDAGLTATDDEVKRAIMADSNFQQDGVFSSDLYKQTLRYNRITASNYEESVRSSIILRKMRSIIEETVVVDTSAIEGISGDPELAKTIRQAMIEQKKQEAVKSYVNGLMRGMDVQINRDLIS